MASKDSSGAARSHPTLTSRDRDALPPRKDPDRSGSVGSRVSSGRHSHSSVNVPSGSHSERPTSAKTCHGASERHPHPSSTMSSAAITGNQPHQKNPNRGHSHSSVRASVGTSQKQSHPSSSSFAGRSGHHSSRGGRSHGQSHHQDRAHSSGRTSGATSRNQSRAQSSSSSVSLSHHHHHHCGSHSGGQSHASSQSVRSSSSSSNIWPFKKMLYYLDNVESSRCLDSLNMLRKYHIKKEGGVERLRHNGGIRKLLQVIQRSDNTILDLAFSVLGNCCMEQSVRTEILSSEGILPVVEVLQSTQSSSIQNRVCRTLGNLCLDPQCAGVILEQPDAVYTIVQLTKTSQDAGALTTYGRTLRLLGCTPAYQQKVLADDGLKALGELLKHEDKDVFGTALRGIIDFSKTVTPDHALQLVSSEVPASLLKLCRQADTPDITTAARSLLLFYMEYECMRPPIGNAGGIAYLMECISAEGPVADKLKAVNCLCLCCQEVVNRVKIKAAGGLKAILDMLGDDEYKKIHSRIISSLICYMYDDEALETMLQVQLVPTLLTHLRRVARLPTVSPDWQALRTVLSPEDWEIREQRCAAVEEEEAMEEDQGCQGSVLEEIKEEPDESNKDVMEINCDQITSSSKSPELVDNATICARSINDKVQDNETMAINLQDVADPLNLESPADGQNIGGDVPLVNLRNETDPLHLQNPTDPLNLEGGSLRQTDLDEPGEVSEVEASPPRPKYSIDSPSYQAACRASTRDHYRGPSNLREAQDYYGISPERVFLGGSPLEGDQYSPLKVVVGRSPSLGGMSPLRSMYEGCDIPYPVVSSGWSSSYSISPNIELSSPIGEPAMKYSAWWSPQKEDSEEEYSSEEEESCETESRASQEVATAEVSQEVAMAEVSEGTTAEVSEGATAEVSEGATAEVSEGATAKVSEGATAKVSEGPEHQDLNTDLTCVREQMFPLDLSLSRGCQSAENKASASDRGQTNQGSSLRQRTLDSAGRVEESPSSHQPQRTSGSTKEATDAGLGSEDKHSAVKDSVSESNSGEGTGKSEENREPVSERRRSIPLLPSLSFPGLSDTPIVPVRKRVRQASTGSNPAKRPRITVEVRRKIMAAVDANSASSSPSVSLEDLQTPPRLIEKYLDTLKDDEHMTSSSPRRLTENYILVLLSRFSLASQPAGMMLSRELWDGLFQYLALAYRPLPRAARIMQRMAMNQACLEHITQSLIPVYIHLASENMQLWWRHRKLKLSKTCEQGQDEKTLCKRDVGQHSTEDDKKEKQDNSEKCQGKDERKERLSEQVRSDNPSLDDDSASVVSDDEAAPEEDMKELDPAEDPADDPAFRERRTRIEKLACDLLQYLALIAESYYGRGQLSHHFLAADSSYCLQRAISIAFICRSSTLRKYLFVDCKGLNYLLEAVICGLTEGSLHLLALRALSHLAVGAGLLWPRKPQLDEKKWTKVDVETGDVCFHVGEGEVVRAHRRTLAERSSVFRAMLEGHFAESSKSQLNFQTDCPDVFRVMIGYLHGYSMEDMQSLLERLEHADFLELLELADQYLEGHIEPFIDYTCEAVDSQFDAKLTYDVAVDYEFPALMKSLVLYLLTGMNDPTRCLECWQAFKEPDVLNKVISCATSLFGAQ